MKNKSEVRFKEPGNRQGDPPASKPVDRRRLLKHMAGALAISLLCGRVAAAQGNSPVQLRRFIGQQEGGINNLTVPATNAAIPMPPPVAGAGSTPYRSPTNEAKGD